MNQKGMFPAFMLLAGLFLLAVALQHILGATALFSIAAGFFSFLAVIAAAFNRRLRRFFTSNRFAVPVVLAVTFLSIIGTLILQVQPQRILEAAYGSALGVIQAFFLDDMFHSFGFTVMLGLASGGLALTIARKRRLTARYLGCLGAHAGLLLVLLGAAVGNLWGVKGRLNLHAGESSDRFFVPKSDGRAEARPLGFTLRLDEFKLLHYEPEYRLMVFEVEGEKERRLLSVNPAAEDTSALGSYGVELLDYWPDHVREAIIEPVKEAREGTLAALALKDADWIFDEGEKRSGRLVFFWDQDRAEKFVGSLVAGASPHVIVAGDQRIDVKVGESYPIPGSDQTLQVLQAYNDFVLDPASRKPQNRSDRPDNPAVEILVKDAGGNQVARTFLFAKFPDFAHGGSQALKVKLRYVYQGKLEQAQAVGVGELSELWLIEKGAVKSKAKIVPGEVVRIGEDSLTVSALYPAVKRSYQDSSRSDRAENPVVRVKVADAGPRFLKPRQPQQLTGGKVLVLAHKEGEKVRDYLSTLSVLESGRVVKTETIEVNYPLEHGGFVVYQADYRPEDPTFSGFQVVSDPGLWIVYLGLLLNALGIVCAVFGPPLMKRRKS
jgi:hypothetical protein